MGRLLVLVEEGACSAHELRNEPVEELIACR